MSIIKAKDFKPENISFSAPKANKHGGKIVYINYNYGNDASPRPLRIQFEKSKVPFGISGWSQSASDKKSGEPTLTSNDTLEISFNDKNTELIEKLHELEELAIKLAADNSKDFFKKKYTLNELRLFYKTSIKQSDSEEGENKYPPRFKTKMLKSAEGDYVAKLYGQHNERIEFNVDNSATVFPKGSEAICIVECSGLWIVNQSFGISWRPAQIKVYRNDLKLQEAAFLEEDSDEEEEDAQESDVAAKEFPEETAKIPCDLFDDEETDQVDDLDGETPEPVVVSKPVRRKNAK